MSRPSRDDILAHIRRYAEAHDGEPPGRIRFTAETGIKDHEWSGVYWTKWSEAVKEAGYSPNAFRTAIPDDDLLDMLARLVHDLGHFPTVAEIKMRRRSDESFPSKGVFDRLGPKNDVIRKLVNFCRTAGAYPDVVAICEPLLAEQVSADMSSDVPSETISGYVYMVQSGDKFKIGRTGELERRVTELRYQSPDPVELVHSIRTDDQAGIEEYWKRRFAARQHREEWYSLTPADIRAFKKRKGFM